MSLMQAAPKAAPRTAFTNTPISDVVVDGSPVIKSDLRGVIDGQMVTVYATPDAVRARDLTAQFIIMVLSLESVFRRDPANTTSPDNGQTYLHDGAGNVWVKFVAAAVHPNAAVATLPERALFDTAPAGFIVAVASDSSQGGIATMYILEVPAPPTAQWSIPIPIQGPPGTNFDPDVAVRKITHATEDDRDAHATDPIYTSVLVTEDETRGNLPTLYFLFRPAVVSPPLAAIWSAGIPFINTDDIGAFGQELIEADTAADARKALFGTMPGKICFLSDYGIVGDYLIGGGVNASATNNKPAWDAVMALAARGDTFVLPGNLNNTYVGMGGAIVLPSQCKLVGPGWGVGGLVRMYSPGGGSFAPFLDVGVSTTIRDLQIWTGIATFGGFALSRVATSDLNAAQDNIIERVFIAGFGALADCNFTAGLVLDSINGAPNFGSRSLRVNDMQVSRYTGFGIKIAASNAGNFSNIDLAANTPGFDGLDLYLTGSGTNVNGGGNIFSGSSFDKIYCDYLSSGMLTVGAVGAGTIIAATSAGVTIDTGSCNGVPIVGGTNNVIRAGKVTYQSATLLALTVDIAGEKFRLTKDDVDEINAEVAVQFPMPPFDQIIINGIPRPKPRQRDTAGIADLIEQLIRERGKP